ncbi:hypothetical protein AgCh_020825 [Apium graveolens]
MITSVKELLELTPIKKVMFSTDGCMFPETFYVGAKQAREVVFSVLRDACADGDLSIAEALEAVKDIFVDNAKQFYKLDAATQFVISENIASDPSSKLENEVSDVTERNATNWIPLRVIVLAAAASKFCANFINYYHLWQTKRLPRRQHRVQLLRARGKNQEKKRKFKGSLVWLMCRKKNKE